MPDPIGTPPAGCTPTVTKGPGFPRAQDALVELVIDLFAGRIRREAHHNEQQWEPHVARAYLAARVAEEVAAVLRDESAEPADLDLVARAVALLAEDRADRPTPEGA